MVTEGSRRVVLVAAPLGGCLGAGSWRWWWGLSHQHQQQRRLQAELAAGVCGKAVKGKANLQRENCELDLDVVKQRNLVKGFRIMTQANGFSSKFLNWLIGNSAQGRSQNRDDRRLTGMNIHNGFYLIWGNKLYIRLIKIMLFFHHEKAVGFYGQIPMKHNMQFLMCLHILWAAKGWKISGCRICPIKIGVLWILLVLLFPASTKMSAKKEKTSQRKDFWWAFFFFFFF